MRTDNLDINSKFQLAIDAIEEGCPCLFITGKAGTGKSTLLEYFRETTSKRCCVIAPTGVAAINVRGQTLHSFFNFTPDTTESRVKEAVQRAKLRRREKLYQQVETIIIDEISMVRADILDCADKFLRIIRGRPDDPFGGVQMVFIGDLYQLPPVVNSRDSEVFFARYESPYFFSADVISDSRTTMEVVELEKIYRQSDEEFINILNSIRDNSIDSARIGVINSRIDPDCELEGELSVHLTTTNQRASEINDERLSNLKGKVKDYRGSLGGDFTEKDAPTELDLFLRKGAQVMLLNNDSLGRWVNGTLAKVLKLGDCEITIELSDGSIEVVEPYTWQIFRYELDEKGKTIEAKPVGSYTQMPLKLAWAITIHKAQGKTFDRCIIDLHRGTFAHGQAYVALSRCRTLDGIVLTTPFRKRDVIVDQRISDFMSSIVPMKG